MDEIPAATSFSPAWISFFIMLGAVVLASVLALVWFMFFHKNRRKRKRIHRDKRRSLNPTLAETGGLPPIREGEKSDGSTPQP
ncbi:MAG TPA: hypothetical protein VE344_07440 [Methylomirabilota bacterium]|nr:hypothetical protein [Methylomirabilota bacterium]